MTTCEDFMMIRAKERVVPQSHKIYIVWKQKNCQRKWGSSGSL